MYPLGKIIKVALHRANKAQLNAWLNDSKRIDIPKISSSTTFNAMQFQSKLAAFNKLHNWDSELLHPCFVQMLALEQQVFVLAHPDSPFSPFGMIQTENRISLISTIQNSDLEIRCELRAIRPGLRGILAEIEVSAFQFGKCCLTANSTYLYRMNLERIPDKPSIRSSKIKTSPEVTINDGPLIHFEKNAGIKYARISNDFNPIHLYPWTAKFFGFKHPIAHGMHVLARVYSKLEPTLSLSRLPVTISNSFVYPASLPCKALLKLSADLSSAQDAMFELIDTSASQRKQSVITGTISSALPTATYHAEAQHPAAENSA